MLLQIAQTHSKNCVCSILWVFVSIYIFIDIVFVEYLSSFKHLIYLGDYTATSTSLIGALWYKLDISVRELAMNKDEDLRQHFHCWWSKELPKGKPFK